MSNEFNRELYYSTAKTMGVLKVSSTGKAYVPADKRDEVYTKMGIAIPTKTKRAMGSTEYRSWCSENLAKGRATAAANRAANPKASAPAKPTLTTRVDALEQKVAGIDNKLDDIIKLLSK